MPSRSAFNEQMTTSTRPHTPGRDRALAESCARRGQRAARVEFPLRFCAKRNPPKSKRRAADSWGRGFVGKDGGAMKRDPCVREAAETKHATGHNPRMQQDNVTSNRLTTASVVINTHTLHTSTGPALYVLYIMYQPSLPPPASPGPPLAPGHPQTTPRPTTTRSQDLAARQTLRRHHARGQRQRNHPHQSLRAL